MAKMEKGGSGPAAGKNEGKTQPLVPGDPTFPFPFPVLSSPADLA